MKKVFSIPIFASAGALEMVASPGVAKQGKGYPFAVLNPPSEPLNPQNQEFSSAVNSYPYPPDGNTFVNFFAKESGYGQNGGLDISGKDVLQKFLSMNLSENQINPDFSQLTEDVPITFFLNASNQGGITKVVTQ